MDQIPASAVRAPYRYLGTLRLALASLVMLQHGYPLLPGWISEALNPLEVGGIAVYGFFILSGLVIAEAVTAFYPDRPVAFLSNRLLRLVPTFAVTLGLTAVVFALAYPSFVPFLNEAPITPDKFAVRTAVLNLFALFPVWRPIESHLHVPEMLDHVWALRIEFLFYLAIAATVFVANILRAPLAAVLTVAAVGLLLAITVLGHRAENSYLENAPYFIFGVAFFFVLGDGRQRWFPAAFCVSAGIFAAVHLLGRAPTFGAADLPRDRLGEVLFLAVLAFAFVFLACCPEGGAKSARVRRLDRFFGDLTYPLYLTHIAVLIAVRTWLPAHRWSSAGIAFLSALVLALLIVVLVEKPVARLRTLVRRQRVSPANSAILPAANSAS